MEPFSPKLKRLLCVFKKENFFSYILEVKLQIPKNKNSLYIVEWNFLVPNLKKKIYIKFSSSEFFSSESSLSESSEEFSVSSIRMLEVCFSLTIYLHFPKNT